VARTFKDALDGNPYAAREIREAIEGKTGHRQEIINPDRIPRLVVAYEGPIPPRTALARGRVVRILVATCVQPTSGDYGGTSFAAPRWAHFCYP
jgi:hypothetical protein